MRLLCFFMLVFVTGCASLTDMHTQNVKAFARSARALSGTPGILYQNIADYRYDLRLIESSVVFTPEIVMDRLNKMAAAKQDFDRNAVQINQAAKLIESYSECLLALTDDAYEKEWQKQSDELSLKLTSAFSLYNKSLGNRIPVSIGSFVGDVVSKIGSYKLRQLQKKYLKNFVDTGALIVNDVCDFFTETASMTVDNAMANLDAQFVEIMETFYDKLKDYQENQKVNPYDYYKYYNPLYLDMKERLAGLHQLKRQTIASMKKIKLAHEKLKTSVDIRMPGEVLDEIKDLYAASNEIQASFKKMKQ